MKNLKIPVLNYLLVILVSTSIISCSEDGADGLMVLTGLTVDLTNRNYV
jgi:hypothetical protein